MWPDARLTQEGNFHARAALVCMRSGLPQGLQNSLATINMILVVRMMSRSEGSATDKSERFTWSLLPPVLVSG